MPSSRTHHGQANSATRPPLIIRAGGRQWVVGDDLPSLEELPQEAAARTFTLSSVNQDSDRLPTSTNLGKLSVWLSHIGDSIAFLFANHDHATIHSRRSGLPPQRDGGVLHPYPIKKKRLRETFQAGLVVGMMLGCLSLLLFHQMQPDVRDSALPAPSTIDRMALPSGVMMPALHLKILTSGPYSSAKKAKSLAQAAKQKGISSTLNQDHGYWLWFATSVTGDPGKSLKETLTHLGISTTETSVGWDAHRIPGLDGASQSAMDRVNQWLSSDAAALMASVGAISNGGISTDAVRALQNAIDQQPSKTDLTETGHAETLSQLEDASNSLLNSLKGGKTSTAQAAALSALECLSALSP